MDWFAKPVASFVEMPNLIDHFGAPGFFIETLVAGGVLWRRTLWLDPCDRCGHLSEEVGSLNTHHFSWNQRAESKTTERKA